MTSALAALVLAACTALGAQGGALMHFAGGYTHGFGLNGYGLTIDVVQPVVSLPGRTTLDGGVAASLEVTGTRCARRQLRAGSAVARVRHALAADGLQIFVGGRVALLTGEKDDCPTVTSGAPGTQLLDTDTRTTSFLGFGGDAGLELPVGGRTRLALLASSMYQRIDLNHSWVNSIRLGVVVPLH